MLHTHFHEIMVIICSKERKCSTKGKFSFCSGFPSRTHISQVWKGTWRISQLLCWSKLSLQGYKSYFNSLGKQTTSILIIKFFTPKPETLAQSSVSYVVYLCEQADWLITLFWSSVFSHLSSNKKNHSKYCTTSSLFSAVAVAKWILWTFSGWCVVIWDQKKSINRKGKEVARHWSYSSLGLSHQRLSPTKG